MNKFINLTSTAVLLPAADIDTDQIIPARFLKTTSKTGLGEQLFADWRYLPDGSPRSDFPLNDPAQRHAQILVAGDNFGCGSSREHAPWALTDYGFRAIISTSFADIFRNNSLKNGLLLVEIDPEAYAGLIQSLQRDPTGQLKIDLAAQQLTLPDGDLVWFPMNGFSKNCLLNGVDELGYLLGFEPQILEYERRSERVG